MLPQLISPLCLLLTDLIVYLSRSHLCLFYSLPRLSYSHFPRFLMSLSLPPLVLCPSCLPSLHSLARSLQCRLSRLICTVRFCSWLVPPWLSNFSLSASSVLLSFFFSPLFYLFIYMTSAPVCAILSAITDRRLSTSLFFGFVPP